LEQSEGRKDWLSKDLEDACLEAWSSFVCVLGSVDPGNPSIPTPRSTNPKVSLKLFSQISRSVVHTAATEEAPATEADSEEAD
jgi:hypothetical protein